jgi:hypothetical protein
LPLTKTFLNATEGYLLLLNAERQIVMASENVLELVAARKMEQIVGLRPGEALGCVCADECQSGCGTSPLCRECSLVRVILRGLAGHRQIQECQLSRVVEGREEELYLRVLATPLVYGREKFTLLTISTLSRENR